MSSVSGTPGGVTPDLYPSSPASQMGNPSEVGEPSAIVDDADAVELHVAEGPSKGGLPDGDAPDDVLDSAVGETKFWDACKQDFKDLKGQSIGRQIGGGAALLGAGAFGSSAEGAGLVGKVGGGALGILYMLCICLAIVTGKISAQEAAGAMDAGRHAINALKHGGAMVTSFLPSVGGSAFQKLAGKASKTDQNTSWFAQSKKHLTALREGADRIEQERKEVDAAEAQRRHEADIEGKRMAESEAGVTDTPAPATPNSVNVEQLGPAAEGVGPASTTGSSTVSDADSIVSGDSARDADETAARRRADTL